MITDFKTLGKDSELFDILYTHFGKTVNKSRIRFLPLMTKALATMRTVNFAKLAVAFGGKTNPLSSLRCIQHSV